MVTAIDLRRRMNFEIFNYMTEIETEFKVNKEKRTVVCIITTKEDFLKKIVKYGFMSFLDRLPLEWNDFRDEDLDVRKYVGIAKCNPEDEWDENYGRQLAEYRAMKQRKNVLNQEIENFIRKTFGNIDNLREFGKLKEPKKP